MKSAIRNPQSKIGFTLIELLVVVTIIVILLALLVPAMDKAIYQAELAVCETKLHAIAQGSILYAMGNKRRYPDRPARRSNGNNRPIDLYFGFNQQHELDDRLILKQFMSINKTLNCPLVKEIDIEDSDPNGHVASPYGLYFGWGYVKDGNGPSGEKQMLKIGDRWTFTMTGSDGGVEGTGVNETITRGVVARFSVLASDWDSVYVSSSYNYGTHPDKEGAMTELYRQNQDYTFQTDANAGPTTSTLSYWQAVQRPPVDDNFAFDDGSVLRITDVESNEGVSLLGGSEDRLLSAQQGDNKQNRRNDWFFRVPGSR